MISFSDFIGSYLLMEAPSPPGAQLFHKDIGIPPVLLKPLAGMTVNYSNHAKRAALDDGLTAAPKRIPSSYTVFEVESLNGRATKWGIRFPIPDGSGDDLCMIVQPDGFVRTVWVNHSGDGHKTLKKWLYTPPQQFKAN